MDKAYIYESLSETLEGLSFKNCRRVLMYAKELEKRERCPNSASDDEGILQQLMSEGKEA